MHEQFWSENLKGRDYLKVCDDGLFLEEYYVEHCLSIVYCIFNIRKFRKLDSIPSSGARVEEMILFSFVR
jgi:hypothetical protein